ncbi:hypothetical protein [Herbidospora galbida]|uniref:hypothetical protein n=1 Tax=Herbidospora galbida TaxID=2575442 RepID=UPI0014856A88|nr:hypothetical protein [Herbidospora galbida]
MKIRIVKCPKRTISHVMWNMTPVFLWAGPENGYDGHVVKFRGNGQYNYAI